MKKHLSMSTVIILVQGSNYVIPYTRKENGESTSIYVIINHLDIQKYIGFSFSITIHHQIKIVSYPVTDPVDKEIKRDIVNQILRKEKIQL